VSIYSIIAQVFIMLHKLCPTSIFIEMVEHCRRILVSLILVVVEGLHLEHGRYVIKVDVGELSSSISRERYSSQCLIKEFSVQVVLDLVLAMHDRCHEPNSPQRVRDIIAEVALQYLDLDLFQLSQRIEYFARGANIVVQSMKQAISAMVQPRNIIDGIAFVCQNVLGHLIDILESVQVVIVELAQVLDILK
jgi:hypothetical protein